MYLLTVCISNAHEKNVQFIMVLGKNENKNFSKCQVIGPQPLCIKWQSCRSKAPSLTKFSSYRPAAMKISELEKKKYRV